MGVAGSCWILSVGMGGDARSALMGVMVAILPILVMWFYCLLERYIGLVGVRIYGGTAVILL